MPSLSMRYLRIRRGLVEFHLLQGVGDDLALELVDRLAERLPAGEHLVAQVPGRRLGALDLVG